MNEWGQRSQLFCSYCILIMAYEYTYNMVNLYSVKRHFLQFDDVITVQHVFLFGLCIAYQNLSSYRVSHKSCLKTRSKMTFLWNYGINFHGLHTKRRKYCVASSLGRLWLKDLSGLATRPGPELGGLVAALAGGLSGLNYGLLS